MAHLKSRGISKKTGKEAWLVTVSNGFDAGGERIRICRTFHGTPAQAERFARRLEEKVLRQEVGPAAVLRLRDWAEEWLERCRTRKKLKPRTLVKYREHLEKRILPLLGGLRLDQITPRHIDSWLDSLSAAPQLDRTTGEPIEGTVISGTTQLRHFATLSAMLESAVVDRHLIPSNPCRGVKPPVAEKKPARHYQPEEIRRVIAAVDAEPLRIQCSILLAMTAGLRMSEIAALEWNDVDLRRRCVRVRQAAELVKGKKQAAATPKSEAGNRVIPIPLRTRRALRLWRRQQSAQRAKKGEAWPGGEHVFTRTRGGAWMRADRLNREWRQFLQRHNLPDLNFHGARHTAGSLWIDAGIPLPAVTYLLGHAQQSTTANIYTHPMHRSLDQAAKVMQQTLSTKLSTPAENPTHPRSKTPATPHPS